MCVESEVEELLGWAETVANIYVTSTLRILIAFNHFYKKFKDVKTAKKYVEKKKGQII